MYTHHTQDFRAHGPLLRREVVRDAPQPPAAPWDEALAVGLLEARGLACVRGNRLLFRNCSFQLAGGELLRVAGANGSGKTSLLRMVCGLLAPAAGTVTWGGAALRAVGMPLAYLGHADGITGDLTPLENLGLARRLAIAPGVPPAAALAQVGLGDRRAVPCRLLSAGQRRRVALARLLVAPAPLWVLDEPYTALDAAGTALVDDLLAVHLTLGGRALITAHQAIGLTPHRVLELGAAS